MKKEIAFKRLLAVYEMSVRKEGNEEEADNAKSKLTKMLLRKGISLMELLNYRDANALHDFVFNINNIWIFYLYGNLIDKWGENNPKESVRAGMDIKNQMVKLKCSNSTYEKLKNFLDYHLQMYKIHKNKIKEQSAENQYNPTVITASSGTIYFTMNTGMNRKIPFNEKAFFIAFIHKFNCISKRATTAARARNENAKTIETDQSDNDTIHRYSQMFGNDYSKIQDEGNQLSDEERRKSLL